jgi:hypothetical protein
MTDFVVDRDKTFERAWIGVKKNTRIKPKGGLKGSMMFK